MRLTDSSASTFVVVLTGGIAAGKTAVSDQFSKLGVPVIDTDVIARQLVDPGRPALNAIIESFGEEFLLPGGGLDRKKLRDLVFSSTDAKAKLESLLHPAILAESRKRVGEVSSPYCILVIPLYVESSNYDWVDRVLVVDVEEDVQKNRVMTRDGISEAQASSIIGSQASRQQRLLVADDIIGNSASPGELAPKVERLHRLYLDLADQSIR